MIVLLSTALHSYTHRALEGAGSFELRLLSYARAFQSSDLPRGTWLFTDLDRLGYWDLEQAARLIRTVAEEPRGALDKGRLAREQIAASRAPERTGQFVRRRLEQIRTGRRRTPELATPSTAATSTER